MRIQGPRRTVAARGSGCVTRRSGRATRRGGALARLPKPDGGRHGLPGAGPSLEKWAAAPRSRLWVTGGRPVKWLRGPLRGRNQKIANRCHCKPLLAPQRLFERVLFPPLEPGKHPLAPLEILLSRVWRRASASFSRELPLFQIEMREFFEDPRAR
jgi:hypothetical protein